MSILSSSIKIYSDSACTQLVKTVAGGTSLTQTIPITGLSENTQYWAKAEATNGYGVVGTSSAVTFTTVAVNYTFSGTVTLNDLYSKLNANVGVSYSGANFIECGVQFATNSAFTQNVISASNTTSPADTYVGEVSGFAENTTYYYRFFATTSEFGTKYSSVDTITTKYAEPTIVVTHSNVTDTTAVVTVTYTGNMPLNHQECTFTYVVSGGVNHQSIPFSGMVAGTPFSATLTNLTPNTSYDVEFASAYYENEVNYIDHFTTQAATPPTVNITSVSDVTPTSCNVNISITD